MKIKHGATVIDKNNEILGTVDLLMRNTLTGEISKFVVNRESSQADLFLLPQDILEVTDSQIKLNVSLDEIRKD